MRRLDFHESPEVVRVGEVIIWSFDAAGWAAAPTAAAVTAVRTDTGADVTATIFPSGSASIAGTVVTLPPARDWTKGVTVRITAQFEGGGNTFRPFLDVQVVG